MPNPPCTVTTTVRDVTCFFSLPPVFFFEEAKKIFQGFDAVFILILNYLLWSNPGKIIIYSSCCWLYSLTTSTQLAVFVVFVPHPCLWGC